MRGVHLKGVQKRILLFFVVVVVVEDYEHSLACVPKISHDFLQVISQPMLKSVWHCIYFLICSVCKMYICIFIHK